MNAWQTQDKLSRRLLRWGGLSIVAGLVMWLTGKPFWRSMGAQFASWGAINAAIALFGQADANRRIDDLDNPGEPAVLAKEAQKLRAILLVNAGLDVLYILGGRAWAARDTGDGKARGTGLGVILQGGFLLVFDLVHALLLKDRNEK
ncbi:MAG: hypothetical protein MUE40_05980 [Anaerolineae bacterium]|jgi:hypothetical protein|nr:hypothetical protein [Anaerolineae bacterium]